MKNIARAPSSITHMIMNSMKPQQCIAQAVLDDFSGGLGLAVKKMEKITYYYSQSACSFGPFKT